MDSPGHIRSLAIIVILFLTLGLAFAAVPLGASPAHAASGWERQNPVANGGWSGFQAEIYCKETL